jgi:hypothetical protein
MKVLHLYEKMREESRSTAASESVFSSATILMNMSAINCKNKTNGLAIKHYFRRADNARSRKLGDEAWGEGPISRS